MPSCRRVVRMNFAIKFDGILSVFYVCRMVLVLRFFIFNRWIDGNNSVHFCLALQKTFFVLLQKLYGLNL